MVINSMKVFDIVFVIGSPEANGTVVIAERMIDWFFISNNDGRAAAIAVVLFVAIVPVMIWNIRRFREEEAIVEYDRRSLSRTDRPPPEGRASSRTEAGGSSDRRHRDRRDLDDPYRRSGCTSSVRRLSSDTTGWWTVLAHPFEAGQWTLENYRLALDTGGFASAFLNSLVDPVHRDPDHDRGVRRLRVLLDGLPRPVRVFIAVVGLLVVPLQMALIPILRLQRRWRSSGGTTCSPILT